MSKINQTNGITITFPKQTFTPYKYYIGRGNNSVLVRNCLKTRFWWQMGDFDEWTDYNFIWTQWKSNKVLSKIKMKKDIMQDKESVENSIHMSSGATTADSNSSVETLLQTPTRMNRASNLTNYAAGMLSTQNTRKSVSGSAKPLQMSVGNSG